MSIPADERHKSKKRTGAPNKATIFILFNKPFNVLTQFTSESGKTTLADFIDVKEVYPAGRLDYDSEGLVILTNNGALQARITEPGHKMPKTYLVLVEGVPDETALNKLRDGVMLKDGMTRPAMAERLDKEPEVWPRTPAVRYRKNIPTTWITLTITEGRNRQVRRMTAAIGHPTLRLIRTAIGNWNIEGLKPGEWKRIDHDGQ